MKNIKEILSDVYTLDPSLRSREEELVKIIEKLISSKPEVILDEKFVASLRAELAARFSSKPANRWNLMNLFMNKKFIFAAGAVAVLILAIIPAINFFSGSRAPAIKLAFDQKITPAGSNAFGNLTAVTAGNERGSGIAAPAPMARTQSGGGYGGVGYGGGGGAIGVTDSAKMVAYPEQIIDYSYKYVGEPLNLDDGNVTVYKRNLTGEILRRVSGLASRINLGFINLSGVRSPQIQNMMISEGVEEGYEFALGLKDENVFINRSYYYAMRNECAAGTKCIAPEEQLDIENIPSDSELISIANAFLDKYGISRAGYAAAEVDHTWRPTYMAAINRKDTMPSAFIPSQLNVNYPLLVGGKTAYEEGGTKAAMTVAIDLRSKIVQGAYNIVTQNYVSSGYAAVTDAGSVLKVAENGGFWGYHPTEGNIKKVVLELDTPIKALIRIWRYNENQQEEFFVPGLIFNVKNAPTGENYWYPQSIAIPLVKEIFDERLKQGTFGSQNGVGVGGVVPVPAPLPLETQTAPPTDQLESAR